MTIGVHGSKGRTFLFWSAIGALIYIVPVAFVSLVRDGSPWAFLLKSQEKNAALAFGLILSMAVIGLSMRKIAVSLPNLRYLLTWSGTALVIGLPIALGLRALHRDGVFSAMSASAKIAGSVGVALLFFSLLGFLLGVSVYSGKGRAAFLNAEEVEDFRDQSRGTLYSCIAIAAMGATLVLVALAGRGGMVSPTVALAGALVLTAATIWLSLLQWRLIDELMRKVSLEAGNWAFLLIALGGGGWAMLAHLGFVDGPAPIDWLTMFVVAGFAASFIATIRRGVFKR